jgi:hypothetical protein
VIAGAGVYAVRAIADATLRMGTASRAHIMVPRHALNSLGVRSRSRSIHLTTREFRLLRARCLKLLTALYEWVDIVAPSDLAVLRAYSVNDQACRTSWISYAHAVGANERRAVECLCF